jgi:hypothetical protein
MSITTHVKMLDELLENITTAAELREMYSKYNYSKFYMKAAVDENWTPIEMDDLKIVRNEYHRSLAGTILLNRHTVSMLESVILKVGGSMASKVKQLTSILSMLYVNESILLEAILRKDIQSVYPKLTHEIICDSLA